MIEFLRIEDDSVQYLYTDMLGNQCGIVDTIVDGFVTETSVYDMSDYSEITDSELFKTVVTARAWYLYGDKKLRDVITTLV